ncbi:hypothetical protein Tco_0102902 [Tanacetum coccineum]
MPWTNQRLKCPSPWTNPRLNTIVSTAGFPIFLMNFEAAENGVYGFIRDSGVIRCEYTMPNFSTKDRMRKPKSDRWRDVKVCSFDDAIYQTYVNLKCKLKISCCIFQDSIQSNFRIPADILQVLIKTLIRIMYMPENADIESMGSYLDEAADQVLHDQWDAEVLSKYAQLVWELHHDEDKAFTYFERLVEAAQADSNLCTESANQEANIYEQEWQDQVFKYKREKWYHASYNDFNDRIDGTPTDVGRHCQENSGDDCPKKLRLQLENVRTELMRISMN